MQYLIQRLKEPSSWRGIVMFLTSMGINISPEQTNAIVAAGIGLVGLIGFFSKEK